MTMVLAEHEDEVIQRACRVTKNSPPESRSASSNVRFRADFVRSYPNFGHSGRGLECLKLTHNRHRVS